MHVFICDFLLDIVQNSFEADGEHVRLIYDEHERMLDCTVEDDGKGMSEELRKRVLDPFCTDGTKHGKRKVGLGLPFLHQAVTEAGGSFNLSSREGRGTTVKFSFDLDNVDTPPVGDLPGTLLLLFNHPRAKEFTVVRKLATRKGSGEWEASKSSLEEVLGNLTDSGSLVLLREFLTANEAEIQQYAVAHPLDFGIRNEEKRK